MISKDLSQGRPLPAELRRRFEQSTGSELSAVRLIPVAHRQLPWAALCVGDAVYIDEAQCDLTIQDGHLIIAHEVLHCLQQRARRVPPKGGLLQDPALEHEAQSLASRLTEGLPVDVPIGEHPTSACEVMQPYTVILNAGLAARAINLNNASFPGHECGAANGAANNDTFLNANGGANIVYRPHGAVDLRLSEDSEMAIEHTVVGQRQVRTFFASEQVLNASNDRLIRFGSRYRLVKVGDGTGTNTPRCIYVGANAKTLFQIRVRTYDNRDTSGDQANCDDVAGRVMGEGALNNQTAKLGASGNLLFHGLPKWSMDQDIEFRIAHLLTEYLTKGSIGSTAKESADRGYTAKRAQALLDAGQSQANQLRALGVIYGEVGQSYGTLTCHALASANLRHDDKVFRGIQLNENYLNLCRRLSINSWANPGIGEAFVTYSVGRMNKYQDAAGHRWNEMEDFSAPAALNAHPILCRPAWQFHWGGVIAESGRERITFENYARSYEDRAVTTRTNREDRHFLQMSYVPSADWNRLNGQSWHEACSSTGFANAITLAVERISTCTR